MLNIPGQIGHTDVCALTRLIYVNYAWNEAMTCPSGDSVPLQEVPAASCHREQYNPCA